jgi:hypothetical protein
MAYLRYGLNSDWYVFWYSDKGESEQEREGGGRQVPREETRVAVWHAAHRATGPILTYRQVRAMLEADDFSQIPGFESSHQALLRGALTEFVRDVDAEYGGSHAL